MVEKIIFLQYSKKIDFEIIKNIPSHLFKIYTNRSFPYNLLSFFRLYRNYLFFLKKDDRYIGSIVLRNRVSYKSIRKYWWIYGVNIEKKYRNNGYGTLILNQAIYWLKNKKIKEVLLNVAKDNEIAISLYKKSGFEIIEESRFHRIRSDQFLMIKKI
jgi:ribosomal protein S18 acetylase RimI-like enzyme